MDGGSKAAPGLEACQQAEARRPKRIKRGRPRRAMSGKEANQSQSVMSCHRAPHWMWSKKEPGCLPELLWEPWVQVARVARVRVGAPWSTVAAPLAASQTLHECFSFRNLEPVRKAVLKCRCMLLPHFWRVKGAGGSHCSLAISAALSSPHPPHPLMHIKMNRQHINVMSCQLHTIHRLAEDGSLLTNCRDTNSMRRKTHLELCSSLTWLACDCL